MNSPCPRPSPRFSLGLVVVTPEALAALKAAGKTPEEYLQRHWIGDWGDLDEAQQQANEQALLAGHQLLSVYQVTTAVRLWLLTEADRSVTTLLISHASGSDATLVRTCPCRQADPESRVTLDPDSIDDPGFMDHVLDQLRTGQRQPLVRFTETDLEAMEEERIGEDFTQFPFLY